MQYYPQRPLLNLCPSPSFFVGVTFALALGLRPLVVILWLVTNVEPISSTVLGTPPPGFVINLD